MSVFSSLLISSALYSLSPSRSLFQAWHLLRVDGAVAHPATANPPALLLACENGVEADMIG